MLQTRVDAMWTRARALKDHLWQRYKRRRDKGERRRRAQGRPPAAVTKVMAVESDPEEAAEEEEDADVDDADADGGEEKLGDALDATTSQQRSGRAGQGAVRAVSPPQPEVSEQDAIQRVEDERRAEEKARLRRLTRRHRRRQRRLNMRPVDMSVIENKKPTPKKKVRRPAPGTLRRCTAWSWSRRSAWVAAC